MTETERMLLDKRDALKALHSDAVKLAHRMVAQLGEMRSEAVFLAADMELIESLARQLHDRQNEALGVKRDIRDLQQRAIGD